MKEHLATTGLSLNEPLLWEKAKKGRSGFSMPARDVDAFPMDSSSLGDISELPDFKRIRCCSTLYTAISMELWC